MTEQPRGGARPHRPQVNAETVRRIERASGALGTAAIAAMDERLPWFRNMSAENRSWLGLVAQTGVAAFLDWIRHPERNRPAVTEVFGAAPRELARAVSLQHAVEMVRVIIDAVEAQVDELAAPGNEAELREAVLTYAREIAFSAAQVYARTAEARGAWDARLEALVVDSLVRGETEDSLHSWASALAWSSSPVTVVVGTIGDEGEGEHKGHTASSAEPLIEELRTQARRARLDLMAGVQGNQLILVVGGIDDPIAAAERFAGRFGPGPVIAGPLVRDLRTASVSARAALAALRAAPAWPDAPRPAGADDLLPERALDGDPDARAALISDVYEPLLGGGHALLDTLTTYLEQGSSLEATARLLFVHPNTVRYRLRRVAELTEYSPSAGRDGFTLWVAIALGRLAAKRS
ncbi:MAG TPA: helix-turn-helix domain-containing protein [Streptosporangiaceae bacterium]|nr:helix-turn-helix domain-containing protein [Streptosporangiaceae bacterium]